MAEHTVTAATSVIAADAVAAARTVLALFRDPTRSFPIDLTVTGPAGTVSGSLTAAAALAAAEAPPNHQVTWSIDVEGDDVVDAVREAGICARDPKSWATVFTVECPDGTQYEVDLDPEFTDPSGHGTPVIRRLAQLTLNR